MNARNKVLIVDDDPVNLDFFNLMLSKLGFEVGEATDGLDALKKLESFYPNIILLDNIMPKMSGWELTKVLKEDPKYRDIPIIMFSALDDVKDKIAGFELGVADYITKPFNFSEVLARIKAILRTLELFAQIAIRESRLNLAEELNHNMRRALSDIAGSVDELDAAVAKTFRAEGASGGIQSKTGKIRLLINDMDTMIGRTVSEWGDLRENEIGLSALEKELKFSRTAGDAKYLKEGLAKRAAAPEPRQTAGLKPNPDMGRALANIAGEIDGLCGVLAAARVSAEISAKAGKVRAAVDDHRAACDAEYAKERELARKKRQEILNSMGGNI